MAEITTEKMEADAEAALAIDRAAGALVPHTAVIERIYKLGFTSGAKWAVQIIRDDNGEKS